MNRCSGLVAVAAILIGMTSISVAAPIFYLDVAPNGLATDVLGPQQLIIPANSTGTVNIYAKPDVRLSGVSLNLAAVGGSVTFTGASVNNPSSRWTFAEIPIVTPTLVSRIGGGAIPFVSGNGIGPDSPEAPNAVSGYLLGSVDYMAGASGVTDLFLQVGGNTIADWDGNNPQVVFGPPSPPTDGGNPGATDNLFDMRLTIQSVPPPDTLPPSIELIEIHYDLRLDPPPILTQLMATDQPPPPVGSAPEDLVWSGLMYDSGPGKNFPGSDDPDMDGDGVFSWNPAGWRQGIHYWKATVTDLATNETTGRVICVDLWVPEPATASLVGLALLGMVGLVRRRS